MFPMKNWKEILDEKINEYRHLPEEALVENVEQIAADIITSLGPALVTQNPPLHEVIAFLEEEIFTTVELQSLIDACLDNNDKAGFMHYSKLYKEMIEK